MVSEYLTILFQSMNVCAIMDFLKFKIGLLTLEMI